MNEISHAQFSQGKNSSQLLRRSMSVALMGILSSCALQKPTPISTDNLIKYPSADEVLKKPFLLQWMKNVDTEQIKNLSKFFLKETEQVYVDDNWTRITL